MTTVEDALKYLRMGFSIIPLLPRDKKPEISWTEYQKRLPTEDEVRKWFSNYNKNIGIICGKVSGNLVVLDFDDQSIMPYVISDIGEIARKTMVVRTGKGYHIYYRSDRTPNTKLSNIKVDVKGEGGYVVAPPSIHPTGVRYELVGDVRIQELRDDSMMNFLAEANETFPIARVIEPIWGSESTHRHELSLGLASFFRSRAKWPMEKTKAFIEGLMRLKGDREEHDDRMRAVEDAYRKEYPYNRHLQNDLVEKLVKMLPVGTGEIWRYYDQGNQNSKDWSAFMCNEDGVFRIHKHGSKDKETEDFSSVKIFSQPLTLVDAWHAEGDEENRIKFTFFLGKIKYQGTKGEVFDLITNSGLTGINRNLMRDAISACVEYYISTGSVNVRESYEAIGVYQTENGFELATGEKDISAMRGTEPWLVLRSFRPYKGNVVDDLRVYSSLKDYFDDDLLSLIAGYSAIAPFSYALRSNGNFFWPLVIIKGPKGTGKTTIAQLFTSYLYSITDGGPSDVTSDFRLLDFLTGTTFPRLVDESENAKFEGQKFSIKISATLKDAAQKQFVGKRGDTDKTKKIYAARTPIILAGNKIDLEDPAVLTRTILVSTKQSDAISVDLRRSFNDEVLTKISPGMGIELVKFIAQKYRTTEEMINDIRKVEINFQFQDPRRIDFYGAIYTGLKMWTDFYHSHDMESPFEKYMDPGAFQKLVMNFENSNMEESKERQSIQEFIDWMKKEYAVLEEYQKEKIEKSSMPQRYLELKQMIKKEMENEKEWLLVTQSMLTEYCRVNPSFQARSLSEVADYLSEFYGADKETFYNRQVRSIGGRNARVLRLPYDVIDITNYGRKDGRKKGPPEKPNQSNQTLTKGGSSEIISPEADGETTLTNEPENSPTREGPSEEIVMKNNESSGYVVRKYENNKNNTTSPALTSSLTKPNQWLVLSKEQTVEKGREILSKFAIEGTFSKENGRISFVRNRIPGEIFHAVNRLMIETGFVLRPFNEDEYIFEVTE